MVTACEANDPSPPDIRAQHRISTNNDSTVSDKQADALVGDNGRGSPPTTAGTKVFGLLRSFVLPLATVLVLYAVISTVATFATDATAPPAALDPMDPYSAHGYFATEYNASATTRQTGTAAYHRRERTGILALIKLGATWFMTTASAALGYDLVPRAHGHQHAKREHVEMDGKHIAMACMIPVLVALSGIFAGLTLGYFSVDPTQLHVLSISGTPKQQEYARRIMPVRKDSHLLLTTLILGNMIVNEALPVITDGVLGGGIQAVVISTALVVIFAEIIPQSICSRHGLAIGATMAPVVRVLIWIFFPLGWPIAKLLEFILGRHHGIIYRRAELGELIKMHAASAEGGGDLDLDTVTMTQGALSLAQKTVKDAMTPIDNVFMLPITAKLDYETLGEVVRSGHSRIPVYQLVEVPDIDLSKPPTAPPKTKTVKKVIGSMLVKSCVLLDPEDATPLASIPINSIPTVPYNEPLTNMLNAFQEGRSHMAIVSRRPRINTDEDDIDAETMSMDIMTTAAGRLKHRLMRKVAKISHASHSASSTSGSSADSDSDEKDHDPELGISKRRSIFRRRSISTISGSTKSIKSPTIGPTEADKIKAVAEEKKAIDEERKKAEAAEKAKQADARIKVRDTAATHKPKNSLNLKLSTNEQLVPADAELPDSNLQDFLLASDLPLGIITLEDVLEELIGEEIYDEYDKHDNEPQSAASQFVPREAMLAARKAKMEREKASALAAAEIPLPATEDTDLEPSPASAPAPKRTVLPKLPKFSLPRPRSQPGKPRDPLALTAMADKAQSAKPSPLARPPSPVPTLQNEDASPTVAQLENFDLDAVTPATPDPAAPVPSIVAQTQVKPRAPGITQPQPQPAPSRLTEALLIERSRRLAAASSAPPGLLRASSSPGVPRAQATPTPVRAVSPAPGKRTPMFKSTPLMSAAAATATAAASAPAPRAEAPPNKSEDKAKATDQPNAPKLNSDGWA